MQTLTRDPNDASGRGLRMIIRDMMLDHHTIPPALRISYIACCIMVAAWMLGDLPVLDVCKVLEELDKKIQTKPNIPTTDFSNN